MSTNMEMSAFEIKIKVYKRLKPFNATVPKVDFYKNYEVYCEVKGI